MKNYYFLILVVLMAFTCKKHIKDYYSGIVVSELEKPVEGVLIQDDFGIHTTKTDAKGYFRINHTENILPKLIISKSGYLSDTISLVWHLHGENTQFHPFLTEDSSKIVLRGKNVNQDIVIDKELRNKPQINTILNSNYTMNELDGIWLKNGVTALNGIKFDSNNVTYVYGIPGNRHVAFNLKNDTLTLFRFMNGSYFAAKGFIKNLNNDTLTIEWEKNNAINYIKYK